MSGQGGYILGDEGSGAVLGKMFLSDVLKGLAPKDVTADFFEKFRISPNEVMESVYNRPFPIAFCLLYLIFWLIIPMMTMYLS